MKASLKTGETLRHGLRRVCHQHARKALARLTQRDKSRAIHDVRKHIKKMRAILRLGRDGLKRRAYHKMTKTMHLAARHLSASRDALVMQKAFQKLASQTKSLVKIQSALTAFSLQEKREYENAETEMVVKLLLQKLLKMTADLKIARLSWQDLHSSLCNNFSRGRRAYLKTLRQPASRNFHEWRKQVKNLREQLNFLYATWPPKLKSIVEDLDLLDDQLGDEHDLVLLKKFVKEKCVRDQETIYLSQLLDVKRRRFQKTVWRIGKNLYRITPENFCERLKGEWKKCCRR